LLQQAAAVRVLPGDTVVVSKAGIVYVVGDVRVPGGFIIDKPRFTVLQALAMAQGANPTASLNHAALIRITPQGEQQHTILKLEPILSAKAPDVVLQPDDIVFVPRSAAKSAFRRGLEAAVQTASGMAIYRP
jgi:polysaccharide export outer membrane protein